MVLWHFSAFRTLFTNLGLTRESLEPNICSKWQTWGSDKPTLGYIRMAGGVTWSWSPNTKRYFADWKKGFFGCNLWIFSREPILFGWHRFTNQNSLWFTWHRGERGGDWPNSRLSFVSFMFCTNIVLRLRPWTTTKATTTMGAMTTMTFLPGFRVSPTWIFFWRICWCWGKASCVHPLIRLGVRKDSLLPHWSNSFGQSTIWRNRLRDVI